ncbi:MAG: DHH family phosphoesterase [Clostridia bacterium]|nr:DHH family phosphoesterase [Clostridia bacterium]
MKKRGNVWVVTPMLVVVCAALVLALVPVFFLDRTAFYVQAALTAAVIAAVVWHAVHLQRRMRRYVSGVADALDQDNRQSLENTPVPVVLVSELGEIVWYNKLFRSEVLNEEEAYGTAVSVLFEGLPLDRLGRQCLPCVVRGENTYTVYTAKLRRRDEAAYVLYFTDITELTQIATEYTNSRPVVLSLYIDNGEEITQDLRDSERAQLISRVETLLEDWIAASAGIFRKCGGDRFLALVEARALTGMLESRFDVLDRVRAIRTANGTSLTLSVGVGLGDTLTEAEAQSRQSLDMALGRGGDQAVVKTTNGFEFYGGLSKSVEKRTKVRTRVMAAALQDMIQSSENVLLMGHRYSDLDCLGSCAALTEICRSLGKPAYTVYDPKTTLASVLVQRYADRKREELFIDAEEAQPLLTDRTLLIITDTHQAERVEIPELYCRAKTVVVIDHHRKMVGHINNAAMFYHEPYSSSASEMVAELVQYMPEAKLTRTDAEALLAGIMLDTRSFVMKAGVRTFEAAAYLRRIGADTVEVKQLFSETMETYRQKAEIVASAERYNTVAAIACAEEAQGTQLRIAAAQAADELLCVKGVEASFVLFPDGNGFSVSARSYGAVNVQLVMEAVGGGGHQTMAGAYLKTDSKKEAIKLLHQAIDSALEERRRAQAVQQAEQKKAGNEQ